MRTLEEIRQEMADAASYYKYAKEAGVEIAAARHEAVYGALAWVLEEPWKNTGEFDEKNEKPVMQRTILRRSIGGHETAQIEEILYTDSTVEYRHRNRLGMQDAWSDWMDGKGE